jgi:hypothetical protein
VASRWTLVLVLLALAGVPSCSRKPPQTETPLTPEAKAYVRNLQLSDVSMKATESYSKQVITEIEGKVTNAGDRTVEFAEVACVFYDSIGQMVLREKATIVRRALKPGETQAFRLPFDDIPASWNNQMPQLVIAQIRFS